MGEELNSKISKSKINKISLEEFFKKYETLKIPFYKKIYSWKKENCVALLNDIKEYGLEEYFIGFIIVKSIKEENKLLIVDGQNRLITLKLLWKAISEFYNDYKSYFVLEQYDYQVFSKIENYLNEFIIPLDIKKNNVVFKNYSIVKNWLTKEMNPKKVNHNTLKSNLNTLQTELNNLVKKILKIKFILIELEKSTDDMTIYERVNSIGEQLTGIELAKNYLLLCAKNPKAKHEDWEEIRKTLKNNYENFIRCYLAIKYHKRIGKERVYRSFKEIIDKSNSINEFMNDLQKLSKIYKKFLFPTQGFEKYIEGANIIPTRPLLVEIHSKIDKISHDQYILSTKKAKIGFAKICKLVRTLVKRRSILEDTGNFNKEIPTYWELAKLDGLNANNIDKMYIKLRDYLCESNKIPDNSKISIYLEFARLDSSKAKDLLFSIENYLRWKKNGEVLTQDRLKNYTLEHIMPVTLTNQWKKDLGDDNYQIHDNFLNNLGNLTLVKTPNGVGKDKNSQMRNYSYKEKIEILKEEPRSDSCLIEDLINNYDKGVKTWNADSIKNRGKRLIKCLLKFYPMSID